MAEPRKRCLYEILGVPRDSSPEEIRSAYRKLALKLHPDKLAAAGNPPSAASTAAFQDLLHAYEVLSDPKERQFYDSHRSQILFSSPSSSSSNPKSFFDLDLFSFFSNSAFSGFSDTGRGFFKVYGDVFAKIYSQELFFVKELGLDQESVKPPPLIGNLESDYSQVTAFYGYWLGFVTVLDFGWVDEYDASAGPNRHSRRRMEEENKKKRKKGRKEYNDLVRDLAAFAKKRDKRVRDMQVKKGLEEERRKEEEKARKEEEKRRKMEQARMYEEQEWARVEAEETVLDGDENGATKKEEFYCVVCNKKFKSDKQWKNHEQSKKHREKVAELRVSFQVEEEEEEEEEAEEEEEVGGNDEIVEEEEVNVVDELCGGLKDDLGFEEGEILEESHKELGSDDDASILESMVSGRKDKKREKKAKKEKKSRQFGLDDLPPVESHPINDEDGSMGDDSRKGRRRRAARRGNDEEDGDGVVRGDTSVSGIDDGEVRDREDDFEELNECASSSVEGVTLKDKKDQSVGKNKKNKKQQLDGRGAAQKEVNGSKNSSKGRKQKAPTKAPSNACDTCGENFDTRNKLFQHLGDTGHASLKSR